MLRCFAPDAVFEHAFFVIRGQAALYWIYEGWSLLNRRRVTYDATMSGAAMGQAHLSCNFLGCPLRFWWSKTEQHVWRQPDAVG